MKLHGGMGGIDRIYLDLILVNFCFIILSLEFYLQFGFHTLWVSNIVLEFLCIVLMHGSLLDHTRGLALGARVRLS
jgi:hypothetical protein